MVNDEGMYIYHADQSKILVDKAYDPDDPLSTHEGFIIAASGELKKY